MSNIVGVNINFAFKDAILFLSTWLRRPYMYGIVYLVVRRACVVSRRNTKVKLDF